MKIRKWAEFLADFPYDAIEDEHDIIQFSGRNVTEAIREIFVRMGYEVSEPVHAHEHGWTLDIVFQNRRIWCQISHVTESYYLCLEDSGFRWFKKRGPEFYVEAISRLASELAVDPRFHDITWRTDEELSGDGPGADHPVSED